MIRFYLLFLFLFLLNSCSAEGTADGVAESVAGEEPPHGAVILVVDGLGSSYVYPEHSAYALDGSPLGKVVLFNLTGNGARAIDVRVPVPETGKSHSVLVTGSSKGEPGLLGPTIFDAARDGGYLCLAVLERGDSLEILKKQDAVLYYIGSAEGHEYPDLQVGDEVNPRPFFMPLLIDKTLLLLN
jgi:2,3-bisphosphoglycerate-independent phosphoglycerate mutase